MTSDDRGDDSGGRNAAAPVGEGTIETPSPSPAADPVEQALATALRLAAEAGEWSAVAALTAQLEARRRERLGSEVVELDTKRAKR